MNTLHSSPVLVGWKEIAAYLHIDQQTARIWMKEHNLPVKKISYGTIMSTTNLLIAWILEQEDLKIEDMKDELDDTK